jgi:hypothetical protein
MTTQTTQTKQTVCRLTGFGHNQTTFGHMRHRMWRTQGNWWPHHTAAGWARLGSLTSGAPDILTRRSASAVTSAKWACARKLTCLCVRASERADTTSLSDNGVCSIITAERETHGGE